MNGIINHNEKILLKLLGFVIPVKYAIAIKKTIKQIENGKRFHLTS